MSWERDWHRYGLKDGSWEHAERRTKHGTYLATRHRSDPSKLVLRYESAGGSTASLGTHGSIDEVVRAADRHHKETRMSRLTKAIELAQAVGGLVVKGQYVSRDSFARTTLEKEKAPNKPGGCDWCGGTNSKGHLWSFSHSSDGGRSSRVKGYFCSARCMRAYHG